MNTIKAKRKRNEKILAGLSSLDASHGSFSEIKIPRTNGISSTIRIVLAMFQGFTAMRVSSSSVPGLNPPQKLKQSGVIKIAPALLMAVSEMESAVLPLARKVRKLETEPPGQQATSTIPSAIEGCGRIIQIRSTVSAGSRSHWLTRPADIALGLDRIVLKSLTFRDIETPNMTKASAMLSVWRVSGAKASSVCEKSADMQLI